MAAPVASLTLACWRREARNSPTSTVSCGAARGRRSGGRGLGREGAAWGRGCVRRGPPRHVRGLQAEVQNEAPSAVRRGAPTGAHQKHHEGRKHGDPGGDGVHFGAQLQAGRREGRVRV